jgi:hypothetical protein
MDETLTSDNQKQGETPAMKTPEVRFRLSQRHHDLALAEQAVHRARGRHMSVEEILKRNGFRLEDEVFMCQPPSKRRWAYVFWI